MNFHRWLLIGLLAGIMSGMAHGKAWAKGEIGFRLTVIPPDSVAARAGLKLADILADPPGVRAALLGAGLLPVYRFSEKTGTYRKERVQVTFGEGEERRLGVTGDLGFLVTGIEPASLAARAKLRVGDFLPQINDTFVHNLKDLALAEGRDAQIHVTRWQADQRLFDKLIAKP